MRLADDKRQRLEAYLRQRLARSARTVAATIPRRETGRPAPLSFAQQQIWLHEQLAPPVPLYNEPVTIRRSGSLDIAVLERALGEILRRHEVWRTTFATDANEPVQIVN